MDKFEVESYYGSSEEPIKEENIFSEKKYLIAGILIIILIFLILFFIVFQSPVSDEFDLTSNGDNIGFSGTISVDGSIIDAFGKDGNKIGVISNGEDNFKITIGTSGIGKITVNGGRITNISGGQASITPLGGQVIALNPDAFIVDDKGNIEINIDPIIDLGIDPNLIDFASGDSLDFEFQITFTDEDTGEEYNVLIPAEIFFSEFIGTGCIQLSRQFISGTTKNGQLEANLKIKITCDSYGDLYSFINWSDGPKGNVEIHFDRTYPTNLIEFPLAVKSSPVPGIYDTKIIYTPHILDKGKRADFKVNFVIENTNKELVFEMINENLEQCVQVTAIKDTINNYNDNASIRIDTTKCTNPVEISICHNDYGCSGGIEGEILPSDTIFTLDKSTRTINFSRGDISGVYGVKIFARVSGTNFRLVNEKEILVLPVDETIFPKKFVVSLMENGARDIVQIKNTNLTEDVRVDTSICNLYESSFGIDAGGLPLFGEFVNEKEWLNYLVNNKESYSGEGFYQRALISNMSAISSARSTAYTISAGENEKIKNAYLAGQEFGDSATKMRETSDELLKNLEDLDAELQNLNKDAEINLTSQMASMVTSMTSLYSDITTLSTNANSTANTVRTASTLANGACDYCQVPAQNASTQMDAVAEQTYTLRGDVLQALNTAKDIYSIYQQIEALSNDSEQIDSKSALKNSREVNDYLLEVEEKMFLVIDYLDKALASAAISSFESASEEDAEAKYYLELALLEMRDIEILTESIINSQLNANDDLTVMGEDIDEKRELIIASSELLLDLINQMGLIESRTQTIRSSLTPVLSSLNTANGLAAAELAECLADCSSSTIAYAACAAGCNARFQPVINAIISATSAVNSFNGQANSSLIKISQQINTMNVLYNSYELYDALANGYGANHSALFRNFEELINDLYDFELLVLNNIIDLEEAIIAADNLSEMQKEMSDASTYLSALNLPQEYHNYNRERLVGIVSTLVQTGFINGAYAGGVYTTRDTGPVIFSEKDDLKNQKISFSNFLKEDCENRVELILPAYKTNLINDARRVQIDGAEVAAQWLFNDSKINDVYETQIVDLLFVNNNLHENSYALVTIPFSENEYAQFTSVNQRFAPFNLPPSQVKEKEYKFRVKFNASQRSAPASTPNYNDACENSLMFGATGSEALPKIILNWDWNGINVGEIEDNYLDATQASILISKKLSQIDNQLSNTIINCPNSPVEEILNRIIPLSFDLDTYTEDCFIPLSTRTFDEKPAIYYYLEKNSQNADLIKLMDFNINLIKDGYGREFQYDFVTHYSKQIFEAGPDFLDSDFGMSRFFRNPNIFYFTSKSANLESKNDFVLNDAGLYNVKLLIDFDDIPLISVGRTNAKIKVVFDLIKPINENFSPFYYLPINGRVGATIDNDRRFYGASVLGDRSLDISSNNNVSLAKNQVDSLVKVDYKLRNNFFELNSLKSNRLKLLELNNANNQFSIINSPTVVTPLLFEIKGNKNQDAFFRYHILSSERKLDGRTHNLFLFDSISGCKDFYGFEMNYLKSMPDFLVGTDYMIGYEDVQVEGKVFALALAHAPIQGMFSIEHFQSENKGRIISPSTSFSQSINLVGINGMNYNFLETNNIINNLQDLFNAVKEENVCVARLGEREIYYWSEKKLNNFTNPIINRSIQNEINSARSKCIS